MKEKKELAKWVCTDQWMSVPAIAILTAIVMGASAVLQTNFVLLALALSAAFAGGVTIHFAIARYHRWAPLIREQIRNSS